MENSSWYIVFILKQQIHFVKKYPANGRLIDEEKAAG